MLHRILAVALRVERNGQVKPCLMIKRIGRNLLFQFPHRSEGFRLFGYFERRARGRDGRFIPFRFRNER